MFEEKWKEINDSHGVYICEKYKQDNVLIADLAREIGCTNYIIQKVLVHNNVKLKSTSEVNKEVNFRNRFKQRTFSIDYDYFKKWNNNMAYILGFIYADGYLSDKILRINLQRTDKGLLEIIKRELEYGGEIKDRDTTLNGKSYPYSYISIRSLDIVKDLKYLGLYPNKSLTITYPTIPEEFELDFIRGYFDGNGSISVKRQVHKSKNSDTYQIITKIFSGSSVFLDSLQKALTTYGLKQKPTL